MLSSQTNYTLTNLAEHLEVFSHDTINRYLRGERLTPRLLWDNVEHLIQLDEDGSIIFDDTVIDKNFSNCIELVRRHESLLSRGAEVNLTNKSGYTPLCLAFQKSGDDEIIRLLVAYGADVNVQDAKGFSPLHRAVIQKNKNMVELLLAHGARQGLE